MLEKILVPLDGSELAEQALPYATELARKFASELVLLWVVQPPPVMPVAEFAVIPYQDEAFMARAEKQANAYLNARREDLRKEGIPTRVAVLTSFSVAEAIVDFAAQEGVNLIVKTTHGRSGLSRWVFGSVAAKVLEQAPCPVFLVRVREGDS